MVEKFGELLSYTIDENTVSVNYEKSTAYIKIITKDIINFFVPKISKGRKSKAIEYLDNNICNFTVEKRTGVIMASVSSNSKYPYSLAEWLTERIM